MRYRSFLHVTELYALVTIYWFEILIMNRALVSTHFFDMKPLKRLE
jgi:hypothetical protein